VFSKASSLLLGALALVGFAQAEEPLHVRVDQLIEKQAAGQPLAPVAGDAEFLRRVYLDFAGDLPTAAEARAFLDDKAADKREQLLTKLQTAPRFAERLADALNVMLMERRGEDPAWKKYLQDSCKAGKPWDVMAKEMIAPDYANPDLKGAGYFTVRRLEKVGQQTTDYPGLTRDAGRMFLGVDLQCCQCHNHLTVKSYKQVDFNGLFVAFQNIKLEGGEGKAAKVREMPLTAKYDFVSVLTKVAGQTGPRVPFSEEVAIPDPNSDDFWEVKPDPKKREIGVAKFSPLKEIAQRIATKENPWFVKNAANRMWWLLMGRGILEPLDQHNNPANPPSHPELLDLLAQEMAAHDLSLQWLLKELSLTKTYQRTSVLPEGEAPPEKLFVVAKERPLSSEQLVRAFLRATGEYDAAAAADAPKGHGLADFDKAFRTAFANAPKEPELTVNPTLKSALFLRNSDIVLSTVKPQHANLVERLVAITDPKALAEELYLSILTRLPNAEETAEVGAWLEKHASDRPRAVGHYAWALLSSEEFFSNH
jgi:hypothetical protein